VRIGGLDQWIHVRGEHTKNPVLLFLHGGPGAALIGVAGRFQTPWEKHFTIVQWDQRGAGKTYARNDRELQRRTMTVRQMQQDTLDMANYLRRRFQREKIVVLGASRAACRVSGWRTSTRMSWLRMWAWGRPSTWGSTRRPRTRMRWPWRAREA